MKKVMSKAVREKQHVNSVKPVRCLTMFTIVLHFVGPYRETPVWWGVFSPSVIEMVDYRVVKPISGKYQQSADVMMQ